MAKKTRSEYVCSSCGARFARWSGRCSTCESWNTLVLEESSEQQSSPRKTSAAKATLLSQVSSAESARLMSGIDEFDLVCGHGIVPGCVMLVGGEPGIGKSTLALHIANSFRTLYISGEESPTQVRDRAKRLSIAGDKIIISNNTDTSEIEQLIDEHKPGFVIVDSVQTISTENAAGLPGSVSQIRESASRLAQFAKSRNLPLMLIGHITKEGSIAGPKVLEHVVDTVLYFENDLGGEYRVLRAFKNRFGSVNEIGLFRMTEKGLLGVENKSGIFLNPYDTAHPGNAVSVAIEGSRAILFEVQSLVTSSAFANPRRMADGFDLNRLILLVAVLEKHGRMNLAQNDVFLNVAGGFSINEPAADLAVAMSVASSLLDAVLPERMIFLGEISLSGEIRPVSQPERRIQECVRSGFTHIVISTMTKLEQPLSSECELIKIRTIQDALALTIGKGKPAGSSLKSK